ncbi:MAG: sulfatase [Planctomycetota bacterium]
MENPPTPSRWRPFSAGLTVFALASLAFALVRTWREVRMQGWTALDLDWLAFERLSRERALLPALVAGALVLLFAAVTARRAGAARLARNLLVPLGHPGLVLGALLAAFLMPGVVARSVRPTPAQEAPNVLFVLIDTWRADHAGFLGSERPVSPNLDALAAESVVFERAMAQSSWTKPSVATLLTGLLPSRHHAVSQAIAETPVRAFRLNPRLTTWIEVLSGHGWQTAMWSDNPNITPPVGFGQGAEYFRDFFHEPCHAEHCGELPELLADVERWFAEERDPARPFCAYVHVMDAHYPFQPPEEFRGRFDEHPSDLDLTGPIVHDYMTGERSEANLTPARMQSMIARYDEELLAIDHHLGAFLARLRAQYPNTLIVLSGDHGEEFMEHGNLGHSHALWQELMHVPLVISAPGLTPRRIQTQVRLLDVAPTLLELVGLERALPGMQGESLMPLVAGLETDDRPAPMEVGGDQKPCWQWRGINDGTLAVLRREEDLPTLRPIPPLSADDDEPRPFWYVFDLDEDPKELVNLARERREEGSALFAELERRGWYVAPEKLLGLKAGALELDPGQVDELEQLGYGGGKDEVPGEP